MTSFWASSNSFQLSFSRLQAQLTARLLRRTLQLRRCESHLSLFRSLPIQINGGSSKRFVMGRFVTSVLFLFLLLFRRKKRAEISPESTIGDFNIIQTLRNVTILRYIIWFVFLFHSCLIIWLIVMGRYGSGYRGQFISVLSSIRHRSTLFSMLVVNRELENEEKRRLS